MLRELYIKNYVLIDELRVSWAEGLTILTGETGAGKSVILGALNLILGERADPDLIREGCDQAVIEGIFSCNRPELEGCLREGGIEPEQGELILRRIVTRDGRSRCFANGTTIPLGTVRALGKNLVDLHGQHEHQVLLDIRTHLDFLDSYGKLWPDRLRYQETFRQHREATNELARLYSLEQEKKERQDLQQFQLGEIQAARLKPGESEELEAELSRLENAERIAQLSQQLVDGITESDMSITSLLAVLGRSLQELAALDPQAGQALEYQEGARINLEELAHFIQEYHDHFAFDPQRLEQVRERLELIGRLTRKYGGTIGAVLAYQAELEKTSESYEELSVTIAEQEKKLDRLTGQLSQQAVALTKARGQVAQKLARNADKGLAQVGMQEARFEVALGHEEDPEGCVVAAGRRMWADERGADKAEFTIATNPGEKLKPLVKIASGGEMSRLMLILKNILAEADNVPTMVFDEIDVGISGRIAQVVGQKLKEIAGTRQVFCITHLPQIASLADTHCAVKKERRGNRVVIVLTKLTKKEQAREIANLLRGKDESDTSLKHAEELLKEGRQV